MKEVASLINFPAFIGIAYNDTIIHTNCSLTWTLHSLLCRHLTGKVWAPFLTTSAWCGQWSNRWATGFMAALPKFKAKTANYEWIGIYLNFYNTRRSSRTEGSVTKATTHIFRDCSTTACPRCILTSVHLLMNGLRDDVKLDWFNCRRNHWSRSRLELILSLSGNSVNVIATKNSHIL